MRHVVILGIAVVTVVASCCGGRKPVAGGEAVVWHTVRIPFDGPRTSENATPNPFRDYRLNVAFTHAATGTTYVVPGFYAADGDAAETSAEAGNKWCVRFTPDREGEWKFAASFRTGKDVAMSLDPDAGKPAAFDGASGSFQVAASSKADGDARSKGRLEYVGGHYWRRAASGEYFLKGGADSPENFLAYYEFDGTFDAGARFNEGANRGGKFLHHYEPHARDFKPGDPTWQNGKGRNIIGALNYLASKGGDSVYFLTYNIDGGDGKDTWMWTTPEVRDRYDCSKLDQWEIVFSHMDKLGIQLHVITQEAENDRKLGGSPDLNPVRKLYYRELVARFSHHLAVLWNLGEENNAPVEARKEIARYIRALDPYDHPIVVHTHNNKARREYAEILGDANFDGTSIQGSMRSYNADAVYFRQASAKAGHKWAVYGDEQPPAKVGVMPDADDPDHDVPRKYALWGNLMGGGAGVEWYFGYSYSHMDLNCEDWRSREKMWDQTRYALTFFRENLPFWEMEPDNNLARGGKEIRVFTKPGQIYAVYLTNGGTAEVKLAEGTYAVKWYNPRAGGPLADGSVTTLAGPGWKSIGYPPSDRDRDWAVLIKRQ